MVHHHILTLLAAALFFPSQIFWIWQLRGLGLRFIRNPSWRRRLGWSGLAIYFLLLVLNLAWPEIETAEPARLTLQAALLQAPFRWWMLSSLLGAVLIGAIYLCARLSHALYWAYRKLRVTGSGGSRRVAISDTAPFSLQGSGRRQRHPFCRLRLRNVVRAQ